MDLGFSREEGGFQKLFENFDDLCFGSTKLIFRGLLKHWKDAVFAKFSALQSNLKKNRSKNPFLGNWEI